MTTEWIAIDFGSVNVRVIRAEATPDPHAVNPRPVQFDGRPTLPNLAYLTPDETALAQVGADVEQLDPYTVDVGRLRFGATLDADPETEAGRAARLLLGHVVTILERDGWQRDDPATAALVAAPIISRSEADLATRLREVGLPADEAIDSALAALAHATGGQPTPGRYGVIDLGASRTYLAVVESPSAAPPIVLQRSRSSPGGVDFDTRLHDYFSPLWTAEAMMPELGTPESESGVDLARRAAIRSFKHDLVEALANGQSGHSAVYSVGGSGLTLTLDNDTFKAPQVAGELIAEFRAVADSFFRQHAPDGDLVQLILVGGGAHWPFVREWATERFGSDKVWRDAFPEEAVVRGLPRLAAMRLATTPPGGQLRNEALPKRSGGRSGAASPRPTKSPSAPLPAGLATALEFFGGLVGQLGLGWFFGARSFVGCPILLGWWVVLLVAFALGVASAIADRPALLILLVPLWPGVPALSAALLRRRLRASSLD